MLTCSKLIFMLSNNTEQISKGTHMTKKKSDWISECALNTTDLIWSDMENFQLINRNSDPDLINQPTLNIYIYTQWYLDIRNALFTEFSSYGKQFPKKLCSFYGNFSTYENQNIFISLCFRRAPSVNICKHPREMN